MIPQKVYNKSKNCSVNITQCHSMYTSGENYMIHYKLALVQKFEYVDYERDSAEPANDCKTY